ncbi:VanZ family protein [Methylotenera sp. G11]|uniref:VanZ family protein n=1 Tax=Methylotenera sp. G11 TaxID=1506585 RepID=UPI0013643124|nr:VanZ family protein [Methylotenera sp. G11]
MVGKFMRLLGLVVVVFMVASLFIGGAQPGAGSLFHPPWDKLVHAGYFFVLTLLLYRFVGLPVVLVVAVSLALGMADEIHQTYLPGRTADWDDFLADSIGVALALAFAGLIFKRK